MLAVSPANAAQRYVLTDLGVLPGSATSVARAISDNGAIAGESGIGASANLGTRFDGGVVQLPSLAGGTNTIIRGINNASVAAAIIQTTGSDDRAALLTTGSAVQLAGLAGFAAAGAYDVNNAGVVTGYALANGTLGISAEGSQPLRNPAAGTQRAVRWTGGVATALSDGGGAIGNSVGVAINDDGTIAGLARVGTQVRAVMWSADNALTLLPLAVGFSSSRTRAINSLGDIAGQVSGFVDDAFIDFGAVWSGGTLTVLPNASLFGSNTRGINAAGTVVGFGNEGEDGAFSGRIWTLSGGVYQNSLLDSLVINLGGWRTNAPQAINDAGQIVGFGLDPNGLARAYLLTPGVPEPAGWAMLIAGFGLVGAAARRRRAVAA